MDLKIIVNNTELDLSNNKFEINLTSFNPLTLEDATRKYTSSIKLPRSQNNDSVFYNYRYPYMGRASRIIADVYIGGLFISKFAIYVTVTDDGYSINLIPVNQSIKEMYSGNIRLPNNQDEVYYDFDSQCLNIGNFITDVFGVAEIESRYPALIKMKIDKASFSEGQKIKILPKMNQINYATGDSRNIDMRLTTDNSELNAILDDPCGNVSLMATATGGFAIYDTRVNGSSVVHLKTGNTSSRLSYVSGATGSCVFTARNISIPLGQIGGMHLVVDGLTYVVFKSDYELTLNKYTNPKNLTVYGRDCAVKSEYDLMRGYGLIYGYKIAENGEYDKIYKGGLKDWSDKYVRMVSIGDSMQSAKQINLKIGINSYPIILNPGAIGDIAEIDSGLPMSDNFENANLISSEFSDDRMIMIDYFNSDSFKDYIKAVFDPFDYTTPYEVELNLSIFDIIEFDSGVPVYIDELKGRFYVLSISGWSSLDGICKVKLLKLY